MPALLFSPYLTLAAGRRPGNSHPNHQKASEDQQVAQAGPSKRVPLPDSDARDAHGLLADLSSIIDLGDGDAPRKLKRTADIDEFFDNKHDRHAGKASKAQFVMDCKTCKYVPYLISQNLSDLAI